MKKNVLKNIFKVILIILIVSIALEGTIVLYNFVISKLYKKFHFIENQSIEIEKSNLEITDDESSYYLNVRGIEQKIYNISLVMNDKNQDVYMRVIINNDAKFIPKENANATKFKVYFMSGIESNEFSITFPKTQIDLDNIQKIVINDNIDYMPTIKFSIIKTAIIFGCLLFVYAVIKIYKISNERDIKIKKEFIFFALSLVIGIILVFISAPQVRYDEHAHFWRAYEISCGNIISRTTNELPTSVIDLFRRDDGSYPNREFNYKTISQKIKDNLNADDVQIFPVGATGSLTPISYIPQVFGVIVGKVLRASPIVILWMGRLANLLMYIILVFLAIKIIPTEKWKSVIMIIALFPMSLNLATTLSPDTTILGVTLLAIAYVLYLKFNVKTIKLKHIFLLSILFMVPTVCKIVYFPLFLLFFILPKEKFTTKTNRLISFLGMLGIVFIPYLILNKLVSFGDYAIAIRTNMTEQILFAASSLSGLVKTGINTVYGEISKYFFEMIGGWNTINIISIIIFIVLLLVTFGKYEENENYKFNLKDKIICTVIIVIEILGVLAAMYLGWTQARQTVIEGVQGRYFLPIIPLLFLILSSNKLQYDIKNKGVKFILLMIILYIIIFGFTVRAYLV